MHTKKEIREQRTILAESSISRIDGLNILYGFEPFILFAPAVVLLLSWITFDQRDMRKISLMKQITSQCVMPVITASGDRNGRNPEGEGGDQSLQTQIPRPSAGLIRAAAKLTSFIGN